MIKEKTPLLLSDLLKIGVKYFKLDSTNTVLFNDGTVMWSKYSYFENGEGSSFEDFDFICVRDEKCYNVVDDVAKTLPKELSGLIGDLPKWTGKGRILDKHPQSVWIWDS
jgi:hypothetical protein